MMETFTSIDNLNYRQQKQDGASAEDAEGIDAVFYDHIKTQLDTLKREPSDESISRILAYSKGKVI